MPLGKQSIYTKSIFSYNDEALQEALRLYTFFFYILVPTKFSLLLCQGEEGR